jgi:predicted enzyme related to lactoylglutathione lyase
MEVFSNMFLEIDAGRLLMSTAVVSAAIGSKPAEGGKVVPGTVSVVGDGKNHRKDRIATVVEYTHFHCARRTHLPLTVVHTGGDRAAMTTNVKATDFVFQTVTDFDVSVLFYRDTLGLELEVLNEEAGWAEFALPPTTLALGEDNPQVPLTPGEGGTGIALAVDDVEASVDELRNEGMEVLLEPQEFPTCDMAMITDPDDNPIMLHKRSDGTHGRVDPLP